MDANTLMSLMGLMGVQNARQPTATAQPTAQLDMAQPGYASAAPAQAGVPATPPIVNGIVANPYSLGSDTIALDHNAGAGIPNLAAIPQQQKQGGFSTGNILSALLGSNFGQK